VNENAPPQPIPAPLGLIEPHARLLRMPPVGQLLYKIMTVENLLRSIEDAYLHFNRVDSYSDFPNADRSDGRQLPGDQPGNAMSRFARAPDFSAANYYDRCRARTYACCFSLENSDYIWTHYANGSAKGKVGVVFNFAKLRAAVNRILQPGNGRLLYNGIPCRQIFAVNYGIVEYVEWDSHQANATKLPNPIIYTYLKDRKRFSEEKELRVSLSATGIGHFLLGDGSRIDFPPSFALPFDFRSAFADGTVQEILQAPNCDPGFLQESLRKFGITPV
jgi:hypothetical protein